MLTHLPLKMDPKMFTLLKPTSDEFPVCRYICKIPALLFTFCVLPFVSISCVERHFIWNIHTSLSLIIT